jgi:hypothetical protein
MDLDRAHAILGVDASTPLTVVRAAYLARAKLLHPDRVTAGEGVLQDEATKAMADLNAAWEVIQAAGDQRQPAPRSSEVEPESPPTALRLPYQGECDLCGCAPAGLLTLRRVTGLLLFWRWHRLTAELCRTCATNLFREVQAHNMTAGWWGVVAPLANIYALLSNLGQHSGVQHWSSPASRDPSVVTPIPGPPPSLPGVASRPGPWLGTIAALAVALLILGNAVAGATSGSKTRTPTDSVIGTCLDFDGYDVPCSSGSAYWKLTSRGPSCGSAPAVFTDPATGRSYCAVRN